MNLHRLNLGKLVTGLGLALAATPALAEPSKGMLPRDSDGIVISIIYPVDHYTYSGENGTGGVYYTFRDLTVDVKSGLGTTMDTMPGLTSGSVSDGAVFFGGAELGAALADGSTLEFGGASYRVEAAGGKVWLRDIATGQRYAAVRHVLPTAPDAAGLSVNPVAYALD